MPCAGAGNSGWGSCGTWFFSCSLSPGKTEPQMQLLLGPWSPVHSFAVSCLQAVKNCNLRAFSTIFPLSICIVIEELDRLDLPFFFFFLGSKLKTKKIDTNSFISLNYCIPSYESEYLPFWIMRIFVHAIRLTPSNTLESCNLCSFTLGLLQLFGSLLQDHDMTFEHT